MGADCGSKLGAKFAVERRRVTLNRSEQTYADLPESHPRRSAHFLIYVDTVELFKLVSNCIQPRVTPGQSTELHPSCNAFRADLY